MLSSVALSQLSKKSSLLGVPELFLILDTSDTTMSATGTDKTVSALTISNFVWSSSANYNIQYIPGLLNTVQSNSSINWNYQGNDVKSLTANWNNTYTNFSIQSAHNLNVYNTVNSNSAITWTINSRLQRISANPVTLTFASTTITDCSSGCIFDLTLTGNTTLSAINALDGQTILWRLRQNSSGGHGVTLASNFRIPSTSSLTSPLTSTAFTAASALTRLGVQYTSTDGKFDLFAEVEGY